MTSDRKRSTAPVVDCSQCGDKCCRYVATQIDAPTCKGDYDNIRWYLRHQNVNVFVDHEDDWYIEFVTDCECLADDGGCAEYETRPRICRHHGQVGPDCEFHGEGSPYAMRFEHSGAFEAWLESRKIDWKFKTL
jgi:Fe-S-cluster containining protein